MSSYSMCPYVFCTLQSTHFWFKRRGFAVIDIDIISYFVVKNMILRFRPCWVYPSFQTLLGVPCRVADL